MSSYLSFYLIPKDDETLRKNDCYNTEDNENANEYNDVPQRPLRLLTFSRNSGVYSSFYDTLAPIAYCGFEEKYEDVTVDKVDMVIGDIEEEIEKVQNRLSILYKCLRECKDPVEIIGEIQTWEEYITENKDVLQEVRNIRNMISEVERGYNDFAKVVMNID